MRQVSPRRRKELAEYRKARIAFLKAHPVCQVWLKENGFLESGKGWYYLADDHDPTRLFIDVRKVVKFPPGAPAATEVHHVGKRRGRMLLDQNKWLAVCADNHRRIEQNKSWARSRGFLDNL